MGGMLRQARSAADFQSGRRRVKYPFIAFMPQWDFLDFLRESGKRFASLKLTMSHGSEGQCLHPVNMSRIKGVKAKTPEGVDRDSGRPYGCLRRPPFAGAATSWPAEVDRPRRADGCAVVSCRASGPGATENLVGRVDPGKLLATIDRGDYWQCAYVIPKGQS